jgi:hypothetical protein
MNEKRCGNCSNCHTFFKEKASYMAAISNHPNGGWEESWEDGKEELEKSLPCSVIENTESRIEHDDYLKNKQEGI